MVNKARRKKETQLLGIHDQHIGQMMSSIRVDTAICHLFPHPSNLMCVSLCMFVDMGACTGQAVLEVKQRILLGLNLYTPRYIANIYI